jgi:hypothetical protein
MTIDKDVSVRLHKAFNLIRNPVKNSTNPFLKNKYADLGEVIDCVKGPLHEAGFYLSQSGELALDGKAMRVLTTVTDSVTGVVVLSAHTDVLLKQFDPQGTMSAFTYGRRYALLSMFNLAAEDDDANVASGKDESATINKAAQVPATLAHADALNALSKHTGFINKLK